MANLTAPEAEAAFKLSLNEEPGSIVTPELIYLWSTSFNLYTLQNLKGTHPEKLMAEMSVPAGTSEIDLPANFKTVNMLKAGGLFRLDSNNDVIEPAMQITKAGSQIEGYYIGWNSTTEVSKIVITPTSEATTDARIFRYATATITVDSGSDELLIDKEFEDIVAQYFIFRYYSKRKLYNDANNQFNLFLGLYDTYLQSLDPGSSSMELRKTQAY